MSIDTIVAVATPAGRGAIGIVRLSGPATAHIVAGLIGTLPAPRQARYTRFSNSAGETVDDGIVIFCPGPHSYTGEDTAELQAHGNPLILDELVGASCALGARPAKPGEFTERAFVNGRMDLAQAEAVADLIAAQSVRAVRSALRTLRGDFGNAVTDLVLRVQQARAALEASIDFADELHAADLVEAQRGNCATLQRDLAALLERARQGARLAVGATIAIIGRPNVGKSSLLNRLAGNDRAIVSEFPGTTRDLVEADILIGAIPLRLVDTAGLRTTDDPIEREGIRRTHAARNAADVVILVTDSAGGPDQADDIAVLEAEVPVIVVHNKADLRHTAPRSETLASRSHIHLSARTGEGIDLLIAVLQRTLDVGIEDEGEFSARARHLDALRTALAAIGAITPEMLERCPELAAEYYRRATAALEAIGGRYSSEDLLGDIFARFCIGK